jgi:hopanoid biosynthesis associated protein HpnK
MSRLLVVTADDFGLTAGVNRAVARSHREGIVTSTSLLAVGTAYRGAVELARRTPTLSVGVHLAAVGEDPPLSAASAVPSLVDATGHFPLSYRTVLQRAVLGRLDVGDLRREFRAQIERVLSDGIPVSHLDTHQHLHLWPPVARVVVELAQEFGVRAVRLPRSHRRGPLGLGVGVLSSRLQRRLDRAGLSRSADFAGLDEAGAMDQRLPRALQGLSRRGAATAELNAHPGEQSDPELARFCWGYRWEHELAALTDPALPAAVAAAGFRLGSWADVHPVPGRGR